MRAAASEATIVRMDATRAGTPQDGETARRPACTRPHAQEPSAVLLALSSDADHGLDESDARARLASVGPNRLRETAAPSRLSIAVRQVADPLVAVLLVAAAVSAAIGDTLEAVAIGAIVVLNGMLGFFQETAAELAIHSLREKLPRQATVVRGGRETSVPADDLVPGDVVVLREGDAVPADGRIFAPTGSRSTSLRSPESRCRSGKTARRSPTTTPLADRRSMVYAGTGVTRGRARIVVTATGAATELGAVARLADAAAPPTTPLRRCSPGSHGCSRRGASRSRSHWPRRCSSRGHHCTRPS